MKHTLILLTLLGMLIGCTPKPKPIEYGSDMCHYCKMTIVDQQHAAELVTQKGKVYMFDAIECMVNYIEQSPKDEFAFLLVNDFHEPGQLIDATQSYYLISKALPSPMGAFLTAFSSRKAVYVMQQAKGGEVFNWNELLQHMNDQGLIRN